MNSRTAALVSVRQLAWLVGFHAVAVVAASVPPPASPTALVASRDGRALFVAYETPPAVVVIASSDGRILRTTPLPAPPSGLALSADGAQLYVTCAAPRSTLAVVETATGRLTDSWSSGHTAMAPVLSPDGATLYVCDRFDLAVAIHDLTRRREVARIAVPREPVAAALSPDGRVLLVANHLHHGRADADVVAASVSLIDTNARQVVQEIRLPNGSGLLRDVRISPDGRYACVTHLLARFSLPTTQVERGWVATNALTLIDVSRREYLNTVLLDDVDHGAANPWAAAWSADGKFLCVTHAGTHELSIIDAPALFTKLAALPAVSPGSEAALAVPDDLAFLLGVRRRVSLAPGNGPRALAIAGGRAYVANYFSDSVSVVDLATGASLAATLPLGSPPPRSVVREGERLWNDGSLCFQSWLSCASCHSSDARADGLNWDNLNDGIGNPKNAKSLLFAHVTPPAMWSGVREDAATAVRAGIRHILFTERPPADAEALDSYLKSLRPIPSPRLVNGSLSAAARRGQTIFGTKAAGCSGCHAGPLFTDLQSYDVGTARDFDIPSEAFDTPSLIECWRTAPYLHDGSAATLRDVLTVANPDNRHGGTRHLTPAELADLTEYLLSL